MRALDTNVLARFFIDDPDDPQSAKQRPVAVDAMSSRSFVSVTVLLEFEWVMRGFYELERTKIASVLMALAGIEHVSIEDRGAVMAAVQAYQQGFDFADALHVVRSTQSSAFATFDRTLARRAARTALPLRVDLLT